jgi:hypothetical protein
LQVLKVPYSEADDVIATLAQQAVDLGHRVNVVSPGPIKASLSLQNSTPWPFYLLQHLHHSLERLRAPSLRPCFNKLKRDQVIHIQAVLLDHQNDGPANDESLHLLGLAERKWLAIISPAYVSWTRW